MRTCCSACASGETLIHDWSCARASVIPCMWVWVIMALSCTGCMLPSRRVPAHPAPPHHGFSQSLHVAVPQAPGLYPHSCNGFAHPSSYESSLSDGRTAGADRVVSWGQEATTVTVAYRDQFFVFPVFHPNGDPLSTVQIEAQLMVTSALSSFSSLHAYLVSVGHQGASVGHVPEVWFHSCCCYTPALFTVSVSQSRHPDLATP